MNIDELLTEMENVMAAIQKFEQVAAPVAAATPLGPALGIITAATAGVKAVIPGIQAALKFIPEFLVPHKP